MVGRNLKRTKKYGHTCPKMPSNPVFFVEKMVIQANLFASYDYTGWVFDLSIVSELVLV